jgi:hypothetical protein
MLACCLWPNYTQSCMSKSRMDSDLKTTMIIHSRGSSVGRGTMPQFGRLWDRFLMRSSEISNLPNPCKDSMALGSAQPLTEMSTRDLLGSKERPAHKADNLTAICELSVWKMWEPQQLTTLLASTACYRDSFTCL